MAVEFTILTDHAILLLRSGSSCAPLTISYVHGVGRDSLLGETIGQCLQRRVDNNADDLAMIFKNTNTSLTFAELLDNADSLAAGMLHLGIKRGDRVGIFSHNCEEWIILQYATARAGIILVTINPSYKAGELEYTLRKVAVRCLFVSERFRSTDYYELLTDVLPELRVLGPASSARYDHKTSVDNIAVG